MYELQYHQNVPYIPVSTPIGMSIRRVLSVNRHSEVRKDIWEGIWEGDPMLLKEEYELELLPGEDVHFPSPTSQGVAPPEITMDHAGLNPHGVPWEQFNRDYQTDQVAALMRDGRPALLILSPCATSDNRPHAYGFQVNGEEDIRWIDAADLEIVGDRRPLLKQRFSNSITGRGMGDLIYGLLWNEGLRRK